ncbi:MULTISPECIES: hypothetical protein [unclassified Streptomyces]|uniref:hypothetical protein n=1 Tax=unclassified Streptomyces TaxID=2593676 RepID=UPI0011A4888D|nr:hypothetical protein [Streptomyces sp. BK340]TVZ81795.1 hypothetical protein FB157_12681 [Streptomyces sp. BK340]
MPVTEAEVWALRTDFPGIGVLARETRQSALLMARWRTLLSPYPAVGPPDVRAVSARVRGVVGGGSRIRQDYQLVMDVGMLHQRLPTVWITAPANAQIRHVNIWPPKGDAAWCPWLGLRLPHVCWFTYTDAWSDAQLSSRTLGAALEYVKQLLNTENHDSPAR